MQCNQTFYGNGFPTFGQFYNCNQVIPYNNTYPEIIGEGEVISLILPDGTVQFFFVPTTPSFSSYPHNPPNCYPVWNNTNKHAWYIRNCPKQTPVPLFASQPNQRLPEDYCFPRCNSFDCNILSPEYKLKFHNDGWTSTTDLHYFFPHSRVCEWSIPQKCNTVNRVEIPCGTNTFCHYQIVCDRPCNCPPRCVNGRELEKNECRCSSVSQMDSPMAVDTKTNNNVTCECKEDRRSNNNSDKMVTTCVDQGSGCVTDVSRETQCCDDSKANIVNRPETIKINKVKPEIWQPTTQLSKKTMKTKSSEIFANSESNTGTCSCNECE